MSEGESDYFMDLESSESEESDVDNGNLYYQVNVGSSSCRLSAASTCYLLLVAVIPEPWTKLDSCSHVL